MTQRYFEPVREEFRKGTKNVIMPLRSTKESAGYDIYNPLDEAVIIAPNEVKLIWTNIKAYMEKGEMLNAYPRSSIGIKRNLMLANTIGIIDKDYYNNPDNDGNIGIALRNLGDKTEIIESGERFAQVVFKPFLESDNCNSDKDRNGGIGSTGRK